MASSRNRNRPNHIHRVRGSGESLQRKISGPDWNYWAEGGEMTPSYLVLMGIWGIVSFAFGESYEEDRNKYLVLGFLGAIVNVLLIFVGAIWGVLQ